MTNGIRASDLPSETVADFFLALREGKLVQVPSGFNSLGAALHFENTLSDLNAVTGVSEGDIAFVSADGTAANNGVYRRGASSWSKTADLPPGFAEGRSVFFEDTFPDLEAVTGMSIGDLALVSAAPSAEANGWYRYTGSYWAQLVETLPFDAAAKAKLDGIEAGANVTDTANVTAAGHAVQPGAHPGAYGTALAGAPSALPDIDLDDADIAVASQAGIGQVLRVSDALIVARREPVPVRTGRIYCAQAVFRRHADPVDPLGSAIRFGVAFLDADYALVQDLAISTTTPAVADGVQVTNPVYFSVQGEIGTTGIPANAVYARPYLRPYPDPGAADLGWIVLDDVTEAWPDIDIPAQVAAAQAAAGSADADATAAQAAAGNAAADAADAAGSATTASNAATAAADDFDHVALTKSAADTWAATATDGQIVQVLVDEDQGDRRTVYRVASAALVYVRDLGDQTANDLFRRYGYAGQIRNTLSVAARLDRDLMGPSGPGNPNSFPNTITASQSGTTITASGGDFQRVDAGMMIYWDSGDFARILDVDTSSAAVTTCVADRSQTVSSGSARVDVKPLVFCYQGDSLGFRIERGLKSILPRAFRWGGYIFNPATGDAFSEDIAYSGGASVQNTADEWDVFPTGSYWSIPSGGSVKWAPFGYYAGGTLRDNLYGLNPEEEKHDMFYVVWERAAGAFRIERRRKYDPEWKVAETVSDASTGATVYGYRRVAHDEGHDWEYRVVSTSGTIKIAYAGFINEANPGYVRWDISRGSSGDGNDLKRFADTFPSAALSELCRIFCPDMRITLTADGIGFTDAQHLAYVEDSTAVWDAATSRVDHVWIEQYKGESGVEPGYARAARQFAVANGHTFLPTLDLFGGYEDSIRPLNFLDDLVHPGRVGMFTLAKQFLSITGLMDLPLAKVAKKINSEVADIGTLRLCGRDVRTQLDLAMRGVGTSRPRGAQWSDDESVLRCDNAISSAIGTGDFTIQIGGKLRDVSVANGATRLLKIDTDAGSVVTENGALLVYLEGRFLKIDLKDASGNVIGYDYEYLPASYDEEEGTLTIRSDVANGRFDLFWNGDPAIGAEGEITGTTTSPLGTWSGSGVNANITLATEIAKTPYYIKSVGFWKSRLTDAEVKTNSYTQWYETVPEFFWAFDEGAGRTVLDKTGNGRHGRWSSGGATPWNNTGPTWRYPLIGELAPMMQIDSEGAGGVLSAGENILLSGFTIGVNRSYTLPATPVVGDVVRVTNAVDVSTHNVRIGQPALHQIKQGGSATTIGTGGYIQFADAASSVTLMCSRAESGTAYEWIITEHAGGALTFA